MSGISESDTCIARTVWRNVRIWADSLGLGIKELSGITGVPVQRIASACYLSAKKNESVRDIRLREICFWALVFGVSPGSVLGDRACPVRGIRSPGGNLADLWQAAAWKRLDEFHSQNRDVFGTYKDMSVNSDGTVLFSHGMAYRTIRICREYLSKAGISPPGEMPVLEKGANASFFCRLARILGRPFDWFFYADSGRPLAEGLPGLEPGPAPMPMTDGEFIGRIELLDPARRRGFERLLASFTD